MARLMFKALLMLGLIHLFGCASSTQEKQPEGNQQIMVLQSEAEQAYKMARLDQAESLYLQVLTSVPNYAPGWFRLGNIYTRTGRQDAAVSAYMRCLELEPSNQKAWYNMSLVRIKQSTQVLSSASRQGNPNTPVGRQIKALLHALNSIQSESHTPVLPSEQASR
ncbi:tetratricopeptide repeat protein [Shewanella nanhaiensis]|uniref:Tetratricopeptide repeat protein n=1 Tax=Shewanella nanhaiensis TaxID=2864872 RepID=A0ABS7E0S6_9GAMM|nr:tetratricopeptide repeat protein [Shewanella nanhaiensis]MBW8183145.1 tetratricopeptide repeat protein [Shewanella nanhaiensis]